MNDRTAIPAAERPITKPQRHLAILLLLWLAIYGASLFTPPLLDDADSTHAQAARAILQTGDWVTLHVNGIRYLEKAPLPYWLVAISMKAFGPSTFAVHVPFALAVLGLALLARRWAGRIAGQRTSADPIAADPITADRAALYAGLATLTSAGVFLFTRIFIPEALLSLLLLLALYAFHRLEDPYTPLRVAHSSQLHRDEWGTPTAPQKTHLYLFWIAFALSVLTKGFVVLVLLIGTLALYGLLTRRNPLRTLVPNATALFPVSLALLIAVPWHIVAALRNPAALSSTHHGFAWFYFVNEHVLRFLGRRVPRDYNKLPFVLYWTLHIVWLFPWILFAHLLFGPLRKQISSNALAPWANSTTSSRPEHDGRIVMRSGEISAFAFLNRRTPSSALLLAAFAAVVLIFFSLSTNQEYYTFPAYAPLLILIAVALARAEDSGKQQRTLLVAHSIFAVLGLAIAAALAYGLWSARGIPFVEDIGDLLAHRNVGQYTLSMSHFFDLTGPSFAALRLPAWTALVAFAAGPIAALAFRARRRHLAATLTVALTSTTFLIAAHIALGRFAPMLSSKDLAEKIEELADDKQIDRDNDVLLFGDQAFGSSIPFYLDEPVELVDGRSTSMLFGSTFRDAPPIFVSSAALAARWGRTPRRQILFVPAEKRDEADRLLGDRKILLEETSGKALFTDRPLAPLSP